MSIPAIPKELLIHSCTLTLYESADPFGTGKKTAEYALSGVRIALKKTVDSDKDGRFHSVSGTLYFDCENSSPENAEFMREGCKGIIAFNGLSLAVTAVKYIYGSSGLHHLEIELGE